LCYTRLRSQKRPSAGKAHLKIAEATFIICAAGVNRTPDQALFLFGLYHHPAKLP